MLPPSLCQLAPPCPAARSHSGFPLGPRPPHPGSGPEAKCSQLSSPLPSPTLPSLQADGALTEPGWARISAVGFKLCRGVWHHHTLAVWP